MNRLKKMSIIWGIVAFLLFAFLTTVGFLYKNKSQKYKDLEKQLEEVTKSYTASNFNFPKNGQEIVISLAELKEQDLIEKLEVEDQECDGYVVVTSKNVVEYKAYIKCEQYKTHGYKKNK